MAKLFVTLSREEKENNDVVDSVVESEVADQVINDDAGINAKNIEKDVSNDLDTIGETEEALSALADTLVETDPDKKDDDKKDDKKFEEEDAKHKATIGVEALRIISARLGLNNPVNVSYESITTSPFTSLKLAREGISETIERIIRAIREFFQKIWAKLKVYAAQLTLKFTNYSEKIKMLRGLIEKPDDLKLSVFEDDRPSMALRMMCNKPGSDVNYVVENVLKTMQNNNKAVDTLVNGHSNVVAKYISEFIAKMKDLAKEHDHKRIGNFVGRMGEFTGLLTKFEEDHFGTRKTAWWYEVPEGKYESVSLIRYNGTALLVTNTEEKFRVSKIKLYLKEGTYLALQKGCKTYLTLNECLKYLAQLESMVGRLKSDNDNLINKYNGIIKNNDAAIADIKKKLESGAGNEIIAQKQLADLRQLSLISTLTLPELLFDRLDNFNNVLYLISKSIQGHRRDDFERGLKGKGRRRVKSEWDKFRKDPSKYIHKQIDNIKDKLS